MDNWFTPILFLLLGYLLEFTRPWVIALFTKGKLSYRQKRINSLIREYEMAWYDKKNTVVLFLVILRFIETLIFTATSIGALVGIALIGGAGIESLSTTTAYQYFITINILTFGSSFITFRALALISRIIDFNSYSRKTIARIKKLGGTAKEIDAIDNYYKDENKKSHLSEVKS